MGAVIYVSLILLGFQTMMVIEVGRLEVVETHRTVIVIVVVVMSVILVAVVVDDMLVRTVTEATIVEEHPDIGNHHRELDAVTHASQSHTKTSMHRKIFSELKPKITQVKMDVVFILIHS